MEIVVNEQKIDFTLEDEKTLFDIVVGLQNWLNESGLIIANVAADGSFLPLNEPDTWKNRAIDEVDQVSISAESPSDHILFQVRTVFQFITQLNEAIKTDDREKIKSLMASYSQIESFFPELLSDIYPSTGTDSENYLRKLIDESGLSEGTIKTEEQRSVLTEQFNMLSIILLDRIKEIADPKREAIATANLLHSMQDELSEISVKLQTGKDAEAMQIIVQFTELVQKLFRIIPHLNAKGSDILTIKIKGKTFAEFSKEMNEILKELIDAFSAKDSVLIGDLLEYEIAPRIEDLYSFVNSASDQQGETGGKQD